MTDASGGPAAVVHGSPTPQELAALLAVLRRSAAPAAAGPPAGTSPWNARSTLLRRPLPPRPESGRG